MAELLQADITENGRGQGDLVRFLKNTRDVVNELQTDHGTFVTGVTALQTLLNQLRQQALYMPLGNPGFVIDTNFDVKNGNAISYLNGGTIKTLTADTSFDTGTSKVITASKWAAAMLTVTSAAAATVTWTSGGAYNSEAAAIAALAAPSATSTVLGYVTVLASGSGWTAGTDALEGGTGGTAATTTNYYNSLNPNTLMIGAAASSSAPASLTNSTALTLLKG